MGKKRSSSFLSVVIAVAWWAVPAPAADKPEKPIRILLVTGGHPHDHGKFLDVFKAAGDIQVKDVVHAEDPARDEAWYAPEEAKDYDAIVLYDLWEKITEKSKEDLVALLKGGKGLVVLHHSMANYQKWPEYRKIMGGRFFLAPMKEDGVDYPQSTAVGGKKVRVKVEDKDHPITRGIEDYELTDEPYGKFAVEKDVHPLLTTDCPESTKVIGWCHEYGKARVFTVQSGHDNLVYSHPSYRKLVAQAIRWVARRAGDEKGGPARRADAAAPDAKEVLATLRPAHPRIILTDDALAGLRSLIAADAGARKLAGELRGSAERLLRAPTVEFKIEGPRLLAQSRRCLPAGLPLLAPLPARG